MITIVGHTDDPEEYNRKVNEVRMWPHNSGCADTRACKSCGALNQDSICLCVGAFTCVECGEIHNPMIETKDFPIADEIRLTSSPDSV